MALKKCPECGKDVSTAALSCPGCGFLLKKEKKPFVSRPAGCVLQLVSLVLFIAAGFKFMDKPPDLVGGVILGIIGFILLYIGGRTKARIK